MDEKEKNKDVETYVQDVNKVMTSGGNVQTYVTDITKAVEGNRGEVIKKMIEEQEESENSKKASAIRSTKGNVFAFGSIVILCLAIATIIIFWQHSKDKNVATVAPQYQSLIFTDHAEPDEIGGLNKDEIEKSIFNLANNTTVKEGGVEGIYPTVNNKIIGLRDFLALIEGKLDTSPSINNNFLLGVVNYTESNVSDATSTSVTDSAPEPVPTVIEGKPITLNSSVFFKTGTTEFIDADAKDKAETAISDFLDGIDFTTTTINVVGTYSIERPSSQNDSLAEQRKKLGLDILNEVLNKKYTPDEISKIVISSSSKGVSVNDNYTKDELSAMSKSELDTAIDSTQGIQYFAQAKTKPQTVLLPATTDTETTTSTTQPKISKTSGLGFFMLLKVKSFSDVFPIMHSWESNMLSDLHGFFGIDLTADNEYLLTKSFQDVFIQNKNARVLYDNDGNIVLMYVFTDDTSVLITRSENVTKEIILRLASSQIKK